jgi:hypothetical protein
MPTTARLAWCTAKRRTLRREPTSPTAAKWVVVGLTRLRAEPEIWTPDTQSANAAVDSKY